ncbi:hypothetical protein, partial [uncultured Chryseobacterium sp.]|uniref:hypothetical protein n=1 Tax=uncultured Chryseobacterium sp. TaxID=259322 RepID=UPI0025EFBEE0
ILKKEGWKFKKNPTQHKLTQKSLYKCKCIKNIWILTQNLKPEVCRYNDAGLKPTLLIEAIPHDPVRDECE